MRRTAGMGHRVRTIWQRRQRNWNSRQYEDPMMCVEKNGLFEEQLLVVGISLGRFLEALVLSENVIRAV